MCECEGVGVGVDLGNYLSNTQTIEKMVLEPL